jgi:tripartite-type tricarboxylate transporter receptor subunit TctC
MPIAMLASLILALLSLHVPPAAAQSYPSRPIRVIVPYAAGGAVDVVARLLSQPLSAKLNQTIVIENRVGAAGAVGASSVSKAAPDGYTILFTANSSHTTAPHLSKKPLYDPLKDFTPITTVLDYSFVLVTNPKLPITSVSELLAYGRNNPDKMNYSSAGIGSGPHLAAELLRTATDVPMQHVPYRGNGPAMTALMGGEVTFLFDTTGTAINQIQGGQVRPLAVTSATRNAMLPNIMTMIEAGISGFEVVGWYGFMGPAGLPQPITAKLESAIQSAVNDPGIQDQLRRQGFDIRLSPQSEFAARLKSDYELWGKAVTQARIEKE